MGDFPDWTTGTINAPELLGSLGWGNQHLTKTVPLPSGIAGLLVVAVGTLTGIALTGNPSGNSYLPAGNTGVVGPESIQPGDTSLTLAGGPDVLGSGSLTVFALTGAQLVVGDPTFPLPVSVSAFTPSVDVTDRAARLLGHTTVDNFPAQVDISDRAARLVGVVTVSGITNGQKAMGSSLPVVIASDQSAVSVLSRKPDFSTGNTAGGGVNPTQVVTPPAGKQVLVRFARWGLANNAAAAAATVLLAELSDATAGVFWADQMGVPTTAGASDHAQAEFVLAPTAGAALTIKFSGNPAAACNASVDMSGWYV